ncbi:MAG: CBS domain-containing protein [Candidatus Kariarchaeaceae archaeon]|jgi:CBS domain-containing protein
MGIEEQQVGNYARESTVITNKNETVGYAIDNMLKYQLRSFPILSESGDVIGIISATDILKCMYDHANLEFLKMEIDEVMSKDLIIQKSDASLSDSILLMYNSGISSIPIVSDGNLDGMFTERDVIQLDSLWDSVSDITIIGSLGLGRAISDDDYVTDMHTLWQVADKIIQTGQRQILFKDTESNKFDGVITITSILKAVVSSIIVPDGVDLHTANIQAVMRDPISELNTPIGIKTVRKELVDNNLEAVPITDVEGSVILITEKDLMGYIANSFYD